jgi:hypothetical protein
MASSALGWLSPRGCLLRILRAATVFFCSALLGPVMAYELQMQYLSLRLKTHVPESASTREAVAELRAHPLLVSKALALDELQRLWAVLLDKLSGVPPGGSEERFWGPLRASQLALPAEFLFELRSLPFLHVIQK